VTPELQELVNAADMRPQLAIYPTAAKVEDLLKRESQAKTCLLHYRVTTFPQVTDALWREAGIARVEIGPLGERLALDGAIARARAQGVELACAPGAGVRDLLRRFIRELKSAGVSAVDLRQASASLPDRAARHVNGAAAILAEFEELLADGRAVDAHDRERLVVEWLHRMEETGRRPRFLNGVEHLLVAEIYDPSLLQFMLVSSLIRLIGDATLTIQAEPFDLRIHRLADLTWNRFVAEESIADKVLPDFVRRDGRIGRLGFVLTHLFAQDSHPLVSPSEPSSDGTEPVDFNRRLSMEMTVPAPDGSVQIIQASNPRREAQEVAGTIRRMLESAPDQVRLDRIAIVARNLQPHADHLEIAFRRYGIPLNVIGHRPLSASAPARVVRDLLHVPISNYHRDNLLGLCRAPFLRFAAAQYHELPRQVGYIDANTRPLARCIELRRTEIESARQQETEGVWADNLPKGLMHLERAGDAWSEFLKALATLETTATISDHVAQMLSVLDQLGFDPVRDSMTDSAAVATGPLKAVFETLAREGRVLAPARLISLSEFALVLEQVLDEAMVEPAVNQTAGGVRAMAVADARGLDFDVVFIMGLNDGVFPAYRWENPFFPDEIIQQLNGPLRAALRRRLGKFAPDAPGPILRTHNDYNAEEAFLFFLAMSMPARCAVLTYSATDSWGEPLPFSPFVTEVSNILGGATPEWVGSAEFIPPPSACFARHEFVTRAAIDLLLPQAKEMRLAGQVEIESILRRTEIERAREKYFSLPSVEELVDVRRQRRKKLRAEDWLSLDLSPDDEKLANAGSYVGRIAPTPALRKFLLSGRDGGAREWSAMQLTELAACGFKFFARRILRLREAEEADYEPTALETGILVHDILYAIFTQASGSEATELRASEQKVLNEFRRHGQAGARDPAFFEVQWPTIEAMVDEVIEYEIASRAKGEIASEVYHELPLMFALSLNSANNTGVPLEVALYGRIDRLEIYRDRGLLQRLRLTDYKTSSRLSGYAELVRPDHFACEDLQMPVYALGAAERYRSELSPQTAVEVGYIALKSREKESDPQLIPPTLLGASGESTGHETVAARIFELIAKASAGGFEVDPLKCSEYCAYRRVCRYRKTVFHS
jgi:superfamily I DNA/RNA helicase/RecB family exonuclease